MNHLLHTILFVVSCLFPTLAPGQKPPPENLVPNPGFEEYSDEPSGWYYSGHDFSRVCMFWTSPTAASPDIYGPKVKVPKTWAEIGFGRTKSFQGSSHAGITVYGCDKGKPHCRNTFKSNLQSLWSEDNDMDSLASYPTFRIP